MKALQVKNLKKIYKNEVVALKNISFDVEKGDFFALLGPNGAGKSTTIGIITSLVTKSSGQVSVFGCDLDKEPYVVKSSIGLVPQEFNFNIFETVQQILVKQAGYYGIPRKAALIRSEKYLKKLDIWEKRNEQPRFLSGGQKRRLMIARALIHEPPLLILDEPTAGVDVELRRHLWQFLRELNQQGTTIILTTHYLEEAEHLCKHIAIINLGRLIEHAPMETLLKRSRSETFVFHFSKQVPPLPEMPFFHQYIDESTLEIEVKEGCHLNELFAFFDKHELEVTSMRNKVNRLEELFITLTSKKTDE